VGHGRDGVAPGTIRDGLLLCFDGAARAVRCARAIVAEGKRLGLDVRAGVHVGDCERSAEDVLGLTVHVAVRVAALAAAGEVLVTGTVRDMVVGSALAFIDHGRQKLRGVPDEWLLSRGSLGRGAERRDGGAGRAPSPFCRPLLHWPFRRAVPLAKQKKRGGARRHRPFSLKRVK